MLTGCRIRKVKCDETKPDCNKCTSTGRKCDGYSLETPPKAQNVIPGVDQCAAVLPCTSSTVQITDGGASTAELSEPPPKQPLSYEPSSERPLSPLSLIGLPSHPLSDRAFDYFIHRSCIDLIGPLHAQVWCEYTLSACATSPAIQHAVLALSGFHEWYCFPVHASRDEKCWRQYYLAVKRTNELVKIAEEDGQKRTPAVTDEILIACAIFITIEILLGNTDAALRHLEGGLAIIQTYLTKGRTVIPKTFRQKPGSTDTETHDDTEDSSDAPPTPPRAQLDPRTMDLIGFFARLDLQVLSYTPNWHRPMLTCCKKCTWINHQDIPCLSLLVQRDQHTSYHGLSTYLPEGTGCV